MIYPFKMYYQISSAAGKFGMDLDIRISQNFSSYTHNYLKTVKNEKLSDWEALHRENIRDLTGML